MAKTLAEVIQEYRVALEHSGKRPRTITSHNSTLNVFQRWAIQDPTMPDHDISLIKPKHIRAFFHYREVEQGAGAGVRQQNQIHLKAFFEWVTKTHKKTLKKNPLNKVEPIRYKPPVIAFEDEEVIDKVIAVCEPDTFVGTRDRLLLLTYKETGGRATEILALEEDDYHELEQYVHIRFGKGGKKRKVPYGDETALALFYYKIKRKEHRNADAKEFFLGQKGPLKYQGMRGILARRCEQAGIDISRLHGLRHAFVHKAKINEVSDDALMELMGWSTRTMLDRYALAMREERAIREYRKKMQRKDD